MSHRILLSIRSGSFETGFEAEVQIGKADRPYHVTQSIRLPPSPKLLTAYDQWQKAYGDWGKVWRLNIPPQVTNEAATQSFEAATQLLIDGFDRLTEDFSAWLKSEPIFKLREAIVRHVPTGSAPRLLLDIADNLDPVLKKLPWYSWDFLRENREYYPDLDVVLSSGNHESIRSRPPGPIKILAVFSRAQGLNVADEERLLNTLPNTRITVLDQPSRAAFIQALSKTPWDIIYFAGHSRSTPDCEDGLIYLNDRPDQPGLSPREVGDSFKTAIDRGLQLVLLNSCDGLGLAEGLADLKLPRSIVMREPVPDPVAPLFLRYFLGSLQSGHSIHGAVCKARQLLQDGHPEYPCAAALPILCQNPTAPEPNWRWRDRSPWKLLAIAGTGSVAIALVALSLWMWQSQQWLDRHISGGDDILFEAGSQTSAQEHKRRGTRAMKERNYPEAVRQFNLDWKRLPRDPETLVYLNNAKIGDRPHLKIAASLPIGSNPEIAAEILRGIAQRQQELNAETGNKAKPIWVELANDNNRPEDVERIAHRYVADSQTLAVIGSNASNASIPGAKIYTKGKLLMLSPTSFTEQLGSDTSPYSAQMVPRATELAQRLVGLYLTKYRNARIVLCYDNEALDNDSFANSVQSTVSRLNALQNGTAQFLNKTDGLDCQLNSKAFSVRAIAKTLVDSQVDTVLFTPYINRVNLATDMASELNRVAQSQGKIRPRFIGSPTLLNGKILINNPAALEGVQFPVPWHIRAVPGHPFPQQSALLWKARVSWRTAMAYDALYVVASGLRRSPSRDGVLSAFTMKLKGATGRIEFGAPAGDRLMTNSLDDIMEIKAMPGSPHGFDFVLKP
jgi:branched-chain amino acid transport system substrate-binding protein